MTGNPNKDKIQTIAEKKKNKRIRVCGLLITNKIHCTKLFKKERIDTRGQVNFHEVYAKCQIKIKQDSFSIVSACT